MGCALRKKRTSAIFSILHLGCIQIFGDNKAVFRHVIAKYRDTSMKMWFAERLVPRDIVRTQMGKKSAGEAERAVSGSLVACADESGRSDFIKMCEKLDAFTMAHMLDDHMEAMKWLYPKEYEAIAKTFM